MNSKEISRKLTNGKRMSGMGRRQFAKTLLGLGFSLASAAHLTVDDVRAAASDEVPIVHSFEREDPGNPESSMKAVKKNVPADWYENLKHAEKAYNDAGIWRIPGVVSCEVRPGEYGGRNAIITAQVEKSQKDAALEQIPSDVSGVPVEVTVGSNPQLHGCPSGDQGSDIGGGPKCTTGSGSYGTLCSPAIKNNEKHFATAAHLYANTSDESHVYHPGDAKAAIGKKEYDNCNLDLYVADPVNGHEPRMRIEGKSADVVGQYTQDGISDLAANNKNGVKLGANTCETTGQVYTANGYIGPVDKGCSDRGKQVKGEWDGAGGDSGGPTYRYVDIDEVKILSMHHGQDPLNDNSYGFGAYHLTNKSGYWFS